MKKILLSLLLVFSTSYAEPLGVEQEITQIDVDIKRLQDRKKFLEAQLIAGDAEKILEKKEEVLVAKESEEENTKSYTGFTTHTELGFISTSGNTNTQTYNIDANAKKEWEKHALKISFLKLYGEEDDVENKDKLFTQLDYYYKFTDRFAFNYGIAYQEDRFSGFKSQFYTGPGLVYKLIDAEKHTLLTKANILYSRDDVDATYIDTNGDTVDYPYDTTDPYYLDEEDYLDEYASYRLQIAYEWKFSKNTKFLEDASYRSEFADKENFFIYSKTALVSKISDIFSMSISHQIDYINDSAEGKTSTDKTTMFNLVIDY